MSHKVKVHYIDESNKVSTYFFPRSIRQMQEMTAGVNISGRVYPLYQGNFINLREPEENTRKSTECPLMQKDEALSMLSRLHAPIFSDTAINFLAPDKSKPLDEVLNSNKQNKESDTQTNLQKKPIEIQVNTNDPNQLRMVQGDKEPQEFAVKQIHYSEIPNFSFPKYEEDWYFERSFYYSYVTVNESDERIDNIKAILSNPGDYECLDAKAARGAIQHADTETIELPPEITTYLSPGPINSTIDTTKKTFLDRWGEFDFECKKSYRPAPNNVQYDYWFRFDLDIPDDLIKNMFEDILRVTEAAKPLISLESFLIHDQEVHDSISDKDISEELKIYEELANSYISDNDKLNEKIQRIIEEKKSTEKKLQKSQDENKKLKEKLNKLKRKESAAFERNLERYFAKFYFLQRGIKTVDRYYQSTEKLEEILQSLQNKSKDIGLKKVMNTKYWEEVPKKISNGVDNQGRLYICKHGNQPVILIGSKQQQSEDFIYLQKNDPPKDLEK